MPTFLPRFGRSTTAGEDRPPRFTLRELGAAAFHTAAPAFAPVAIGFSRLNPMNAVRQFINANPIGRVVQDFNFNLQYNRDRALGGFVNPSGVGPPRANFDPNRAPPYRQGVIPPGFTSPNYVQSGLGSASQQQMIAGPSNEAVVAQLRDLTNVTKLGFAVLTSSVQNLGKQLLLVNNSNDNNGRQLALISRSTNDNFRTAQITARLTDQSQAKLSDMVDLMRKNAANDRLVAAENAIEAHKEIATASESGDTSRRGGRRNLLMMALPLVEGIGAALLASLRGVRTAAAALGTNIARIFRNERFLEFIRPIREAFGRVGQTVARLLRPVTRLLEPILEVLSRITRTLGTVLRPLVRFLEPLMAIGGRLLRVARIVPILGAVLTIVDAFRGFVDGFRRSGGNIFERLFNGLVTSIRYVIRGFIDPLMWLVDQIKNGVASIMDAFGFNRLAQQMRNFSFQRLFDRLVEIFVPNQSQLARLGDMVLQMIANFLDRIPFPGAHRVANAVRGMGQRAVEHADQVTTPPPNAPPAMGPVAPPTPAAVPHVDRNVRERGSGRGGRNFYNPANVAAALNRNPGVQAAIAEGSRVTHMDTNLMGAIAGRETANTMRPTIGAPTSSALGLFQFTRGTWISTIMRYGPQHGINVRGMSRAQLLALRNDPRISSIMAAHLADDNRRGLRAGLNGREPTPAEIYMAHFLGVGSARRRNGALGVILGAAENPNQSIRSVLSADAIHANRGVFNNGNMTVGQAYSSITNDIDRRMDAYREATGQPPAPAATTTAITPQGQTTPVLSSSDVRRPPLEARGPAPGHRGRFNLGAHFSERPVGSIGGITEVQANALWQQMFGIGSRNPTTEQLAARAEFRRRFGAPGQRTQAQQTALDNWLRSSRQVRSSIDNRRIQARGGNYHTDAEGRRDYWDWNPFAQQHVVGPDGQDRALISPIDQADLMTSDIVNVRIPRMMEGVGRFFNQRHQQRRQGRTRPQSRILNNQPRTNVQPQPRTGQQARTISSSTTHSTSRRQGPQGDVTVNNNTTINRNHIENHISNGRQAPARIQRDRRDLDWR